MLKCHECKKRFPDELIQFGHFDGVTKSTCPICALKLVNEIHGLPPDTPFRGKIAQDMYEQAKSFLKKKSRRSKP